MIHRLSFIYAEHAFRDHYFPYKYKQNLQITNTDVRKLENNSFKRRPVIFDVLAENLFSITLIFYSLWILLGVLFYKYHNSWSFSTAFYFTMEAGLSIGFCEPKEPNNNSKIFTIFLVLAGSSLIAGSLGAVSMRMISTKAVLLPKSAEKEHYTEITFEDTDTKRITIKSFLNKIWYEFKVFIGWYSFRDKVRIVFIFVVWMMIGVVYGMNIEKWSFITSLYWAVTSCSTGGLMSAPCNHGTTGKNCEMGMRGLLMGLYFLIGVPIYTCTMGNFARIAIDKAMKENRKNMLKVSITEQEFVACCRILSDDSSNSLNCGEYILLELMRLRVVTPDQIRMLKKKFHKLDRDGLGVVTLDALKAEGSVVASKRRQSVARSGNVPMMTVLRPAAPIEPEQQVELVLRYEPLAKGEPTDDHKADC